MSGFVAFGGARPTPRHETPLLPPASPWSPLRRKVFLAIWIAALASNIGTWMQNVGAAWLMTSLSPSPLMVSLIQTAGSLPIFLLALPAGALADIFDRRRLLIVSQAWMLLAAGALGLMTLEGVTSASSLLILSFMLGIGSALNAPAWQSIIPELVPHEELAPAVTLNSINYNLSRAAGPAIGGLVVSWFGAGANFLINAASFLGVIIVLYGWKRDAQTGVLPGERVMGAIRTGMRYVRYAPVLRAVLIRTAAFTIGASAMWAVLPLIARWRLGLGAAGFGLLLGWFGSGAVLGGALLARIQRRLSFDSIVHLSTAIFILITIGLAMTRDPIVAYTLLAIGGAAWTSAFSILNVAAQLSVPRWVQGRALAVYQIVLQGGVAGGSLVWGFVGEKYGLPIALFAGAGALLLEFAVFKYRISSAATLDLETVEYSPAPQTAVQIQPDGGPVLVMVEYKIDPARAEEFVGAMRELRRIRLRDGAVYWGLFFDAAEPDKYLEHFVTETWVEHLRQHERMVQSDVVFASTARSFHIGEHPPAVKHLVSGQSVLRHEVKFGPPPEDSSARSRVPLSQK